MEGIFIQGAWRMTTSKRHEQGLATRRAVLGEAHVACAQAQTSAFDAPFQELITEAAWGMFGRGQLGITGSALS